MRLLDDFDLLNVSLDLSRRSPHRGRREEIIAAAIRAFSTKGFSRASMADVIAESGRSAGAIYGHFSGKREAGTRWPRA